GPALPQNWVDIDNRCAIVAAVEHVLARGFRRIAFAGYRTPNVWDTERAAGFRDGLAAAGISADQADMLLVDDGNARGKIRSLLSAGRPGLRPDAGVGVGTVSRVLIRSDQVRESTMRAVLDSIERLGYRPSHAAAALVRGTPHTVALIVAHMTRPSAVVRVASALAVLEEQGYD